MKIAQIAQVCVSVPPKDYGGTELIISLLTEELVKRGHDVTLFATGDARTRAKLHSIYKQAAGFGNDTAIMHLASVSDAFKYIREDGKFDIIHNHAGYWGMTLAQFSATPVVTTLHNDYISPGTPEFDFLKNTGYYVAISNNQYNRLAGLRYAGMVHNAIDTEIFQLERNKEDYILFCGNMCKDKGPDVAVKVAGDLNKKIVMLCKIDPGPQQLFYEKEVQPYMDEKFTSFYKLVGREKKKDIFSKAKCFVYPIDWEEPFGLVIIEAMACGTPVVAYKRGSVPEIVKDRETGFVVETYDDFLSAVKNIETISPDDCRRRVVENFSVKNMVNGYLDVYKRIIGKNRLPLRAA